MASSTVGLFEAYKKLLLVRAQYFQFYQLAPLLPVPTTSKQSGKYSARADIYIYIYIYIYTFTHTYVIHMYAHNYVLIHTHSISFVCSSRTVLIHETSLPYTALHCDPLNR